MTLKETVMCMGTNTKRTKTLRKDLTVYKVVKVYQTPFGRKIKGGYISHYEYVLGELDTAEIGFTYSAGMLDEVEEMAWADGHPKWFVNTGFHSALTRERVENERCLLTPNASFEIAECIIPKGSKVIYGRSDLIVSNQIIIKCVLE